jgi:hypothetical protein
MVRRTLTLIALLLAVAIPMSASQFVDMPFDQIARGSKYIVRGTVVDTFATWDESRETIWTYATIRVNRYFGDATGPDTLVVRNVGGTVDGFTQEAIGFPVLRRGEHLVVMLTEDGADLTIHAFNQGKFLVQNRGGVEVLVEDPVKQGDLRAGDRPRFHAEANAIDDSPALTIDEFSSMVNDARGNNERRSIMRQQQ